jgi:hypothetical protein
MVSLTFLSLRTHTTMANWQWLDTWQCLFFFGPGLGFE